MQDFMKNEVTVDDTVAYLAPNRRSLQTGVVIKVTPQGFTIRNPITKRVTNRHFSLVILQQKGRRSNWS